MSNAVETETLFTDWNCLVTAFNKNNWEIKEKSKIRTYEYDKSKNKIFDYIARNPMVSGYDIGLLRAGDEIKLFLDFYGGSIEAALGENLCKLKSDYAKAVLEEMYESVELVETLLNGVLILEADDGL